MGYATWFISFVLSCVVMCSNATCVGEFSENRLLLKIDKLLNQKEFEIIKGVRIRSETDKLSTVKRGYNSSCELATRARIIGVASKLKQILNNHVLEFDLASLLTNGKLHFDVINMIKRIFYVALSLRSMTRSSSLFPAHSAPISC